MHQMNSAEPIIRQRTRPSRLQEHQRDAAAEENEDEYESTVEGQIALLILIILAVLILALYPWPRPRTLATKFGPAPPQPCPRPLKAQHLEFSLFGNQQKPETVKAAQVAKQVKQRPPLPQSISMAPEKPASKSASAKAPLRTPDLGAYF